MSMLKNITILLLVVLLGGFITEQKIDQGDNNLTGIRKETSFIWPVGKKMGLSLTFDDARLTQVDKGIPLLDKYGVKATFYVSPENLILRTDKWRQAIANGHEAGNHSMVHPCTGNFDWTKGRELESYDLKKMKEELKAANKFIKDSLGVDAVSYAYPCGQTFVGRGAKARSYVPLVASLFETGRGWLDEGPNNPAVCDLSQLSGMELDGKSFDEIKQLIESAKKTGKWLILAGHEIDDSGEQTTLLSVVDSICRYALDPANEIWIDNVHNIATYVNSKRNQLNKN